MAFSHIDKHGTANFVDISGKNHSVRQAKAFSKITMNSKAFSLLKEDRTKKGNVLSVAQLAGIMAAKKTHELIPLCHSIPINSIEVSFETDAKNNSLKIFSNIKAVYKTGVEMEALTAVTIAALTVYDMIKSVDKAANITNISLLSKTGGKSGKYEA